MELRKDKYYLLIIKYLGRELEYKGKIVYLDEKEVGIRTNEDCDLRFKLKEIIFFKEIEEQKKEARIVVRKKGPFTESEKPVGL